MGRGWGGAAGGRARPELTGRPGPPGARRGAREARPGIQGTWYPCRHPRLGGHTGSAEILPAAGIFPALKNPQALTERSETLTGRKRGAGRRLFRRRGRRGLSEGGRPPRCPARGALAAARAGQGYARPAGPGGRRPAAGGGSVGAPRSADARLGRGRPGRGAPEGRGCGERGPGPQRPPRPRGADTPPARRRSPAPPPGPAPAPCRAGARSQAPSRRRRRSARGTRRERGERGAAGLRPRVPRLSSRAPARAWSGPRGAAAADAASCEAAAQARRSPRSGSPSWFPPALSLHLPCPPGGGGGKRRPGARSPAGS